MITTFWQSLSLLQHELDRDTADYYYDGDKNAHYLGETAYTDHPGPATDVPAWSFGRLWQLMYESKVTYDYSTNEPIEKVMDSLVQAVGRLAKQKRIKYGDIQH